MTKLTPKQKILAYICAKCLKVDAEKLAWFYGNESMFADSLLCNKCFKESFNFLTIQQKKEWSFYEKKN